MRIFDSNYSDWKAGDKIVWCDKRDICSLFTITEINVSARWAFWEDSGTRQGSQWENLLRVAETKIDTTSMTDLEKLINELLKIPSLTLQDDEGTVVAQWTSCHADYAIIQLEDCGDRIYLAPSQALALYDWLGNQRHNLEQLRDALQAKRVEEEATREQREAERLSALKAKHSDAVTAWQQDGCVGPCPSFEDIANPKVDFIRKYPCWELLMKERRG